MKQRTNTALLIHILFVKYLDFGIASTITVGKQSQNKYQSLKCQTLKLFILNKTTYEQFQYSHKQTAMMPMGDTHVNDKTKKFA